MADSGSENAPRPPPETTFQTLKRIVVSQPNESVMFILRVVTIIMTILYMIPNFPDSERYYSKALIANAATSSLRLHQRLAPFQFSREYLSLVLLEDASHYLIYSMVFVFNKPMTMVLLPVFLFALLHSSRFLLNLLQGANLAGGVQHVLSNFIQRYQTDLLLTIAASEIVILPSILVGIFTGLMSILTPVMYYRFVLLRYSSMRNPYSRNAFHTARQQTEKIAAWSVWPNFVPNILRKLIEFTCYMAPQPIPRQ